MILTPEKIKDYLKRHSGQGICDREVTDLFETLAESEHRRELAEEALVFMARPESNAKIACHIEELLGEGCEIGPWEVIAYAYAISEHEKEAEKGESNEVA